MELSVAIVAQNEADRLAACLKSVTFASETILVDSGSTDETLEIASAYECKIHKQKWLGYARQKQFAVDMCKNEWVLILDADERVPEETQAGIKTLLKQKPKMAAYQFNRKNIFHNKWIQTCGWWPNHVVRLVNKKMGGFSDHRVHENWVTQGEIVQMDLCIEHHSFRNYAELIHKMQEYSTLSAHDMYEKNKRVLWWSPLSHGFWMFIRTYIFKAGILSGFDGFMIALLNAGGSFMKYAKLREMNLYPNSIIP